MPSPRRLRSGLPELFGQDRRTRFLALLATHGPTRPQWVANNLKMERGHAWYLVDHYRRAGILAKAEDGTYWLAPFRGIGAMYALLRKLTASTQRWPVSEGSRAVSGVPVLLGGPNRTKLLVMLTALGSLSYVDMAKLTGISRESVKHAVDHFVREGIARRHSDGETVMVSLNADFEAAAELEALCRAICDDVIDVRVAQAYQAALEAARRQEHSPSALPDQIERLLPFGFPQQSRLLLEIATRGCTTYGRLARVLGTTVDSVKGAASSLERHRLVAAKTVGSGYRAKRWIALDPRHPLTPAVRSFAAAVTETQGVKNVVGPPSFPPLGPTYRPGEVPTCLIGEDAPNLLLLTISKAGAITERDLVDAVRKFGVPRRRVRKWLKTLHSEGLVSRDERNPRTEIRIETSPPYGPAVVRLLKGAGEFLSTHRGEIDPTHVCNSRRPSAA
jgi:hypothetical protein